MILANLLLLSSCKQEPVQIIEAPKISCKDIVLENGSEFNYEDFCEIEGNVTLSNIDTKKEGEQILKVTAERGGSISTASFLVTVKAPKPKLECDIYEELNEDETECVCKKDFERNEDGACELIQEEKPQESQNNSNSNNQSNQNQNQNTQPTYNEPVYTPPQETYTPPVEVQHGSIYFMPHEYGGYDEAYNACVARCQGMAGSCECVPTSSEDGYVLNY